MSTERGAPGGPPVLFAVPSYPPPVVGGLERQAHELARALVRRGVPVEVVSGRTHPGQPSFEVFEGVPVRRLPEWPGVLRPAGQALALAWWLAARRGRYRVVHLHNISWFGAAVLWVAAAVRRPVLTKLPGLGPTGGLPLQLSRRGAGVWLGTFRRSRAVVALSDDSFREAASVGYPTERIFRTTNGVDTRCFHPPAARTEGAPPTAVYVGRLSAEKGVLDLVEAWPAVVARVPAARLEIWGDGPQAAEVGARVAALGVGGSVRLAGATDDVAEVIRGADVFVLPSHTEGNSNALLEAMATGLAPVATAVGGTPMLMGPEGASWLVPPADPPRLAERIAALLEDPARRRALGEAMLGRVRAHFDIDVVAEVYLRAYACLAAGEPDRVRALGSPLFEQDAPSP